MNEAFLKRMGDRPRVQKAFWYVLAVFVFSFFFLLFQGGKLATMLFTIVAILSVYLVLGNWSGIKRAQGVRTLANAEQEVRLDAGQSLQVQLQLQIPGVWPVPYVMVKDRLIRQNGEETVFEGSLVPDWRRRGELTYLTSPLKRGVYTFGITECATEDVFGLFQHRGRLELPQQLSVLPQTVAIKDWLQFHQMLNGMQHHSITTRAHRETTQINGVREYIYGDRLSRIHWNATARTGTWKSKEFERESLPKTVLMLDRSSQSYMDSGQFELAVSVAASLFRYGVSRELALGLLTVGTDAVYVEPKQGQNHHKQIMKHLVHVEADGSYPLFQIVKERSRQLPPGSFFVLISPQKGTGMLQILNWLHERQLNPCHICINSSQERPAENAPEEWIKKIRSQGYMGYELSNLTDLPDVLGGAKRYAYRK
ncbi:DUF58 domain-containing protein [Paenibacillus eucommiae]|uniref:Uncharacterized protein (DUF58 family) n=1 Tax=Paenibacillus eucommiae TaxID=1355755 RepID=A0ABS4J1A6_9BACL|nr:DUF58 domain-containing protein [Paenibacillus eucommiae]MBP1992906.1 uncharacterized protein (DUF58 family) [Paenibacillus eucommiae]